MATLKISDLSVGDWVGYNGKSYRTVIVDALDQTATIFGNDEQGDIHIEQLAPIPITAEILEKNGFEKNGEYNEWNIGTWRTPYLLGVSLERPAITIKWNGSSVFIDKAKYIHQLQHALRLAGVDKEINL